MPITGIVIAGMGCHEVGMLFADDDLVIGESVDEVVLHGFSFSLSEFVIEVKY